VSSWSSEFEDVKMRVVSVHEAAVNRSIQHDGAVAHALKDWSDAYGVRGCGLHTHLYMRAVRSSHQDGGGACFQKRGMCCRGCTSMRKTCRRLEGGG
jgi:hypothetical protein